MIGLTSALTHLHGLRIIHRDVKLASRLLKSLFWWDWVRALDVQ